MAGLWTVRGTSWISVAAVVVCFLLLSSGLIVLFTNASIRKYEDHPLHRHKRWFEEENCHLSLDVGRQGGSFTSPEYPESYPSSSNCSWLLTGPVGSTIHLNFEDLDLEDIKDCLYDYVEIFDGPDTSSSILGRLCGQMTNHHFTSTSNIMLVTFASDSAYEEKGFKADYVLDIADACNATLSAMEGVVTSPSYPNHYPDNIDCWTVIRAPAAGDKIKLNFALLEIEPSDDCSFDFVEVLDGSTPDSPTFGRFCQNPEPIPIYSTEDSVTVHFKSDQLVTTKGFVLMYEIITEFKPTQSPAIGECQWQMRALNGTISSPNYPDNYKDDQTCEFVLTAPLGYCVQLRFDDIMMEDDDACQFDHVEIRDGPTSDGVLLGKYCGGTEVGTTVRSITNYMFVRFKSDNFAQFRGFIARYVAVKELDKTEGEKVNLFHSEEVSEEITDDEEELMTDFNWIEKPNNITINEGQSHVLTCRIADEKVTTTWLKDTQLLQSQRLLPTGLSLLSNFSLLINSMSWKLEGTYTCIVIGKKHVMSTSVHVALNTHLTNNCDVKLSSAPSNMTLIEGGFGFLSCFAINADVSWLRDGEPLIFSKRIVRLPYGFLLLSKARPDDEGIYSCVATHKQTNCSVQVDAFVKVIAKPDIAQLCGRPRLSEPATTKPHLKRGRIVGGNDADIGSAPWQVMLWESEMGEFCGGSLLNAQWVMTAAHCIALFPERARGRQLEPSYLVLKLGKRDRTRKETHETRMQAEEFILHPEYNVNSFDNDIALIRMKNPVDFTDYILPICLGQESFLNTYVYEKTVMGTVTGWGYINERGARPRYLQEIRLPLVDSETCKKSTKLFFSDRMFCAGYPQEIIGDACHGDSGGPFNVKINNRWYLAGVVSWGEGCAREGQYGFYTKVGKFAHWINELIN